MAEVAGRQSVTGGISQLSDMKKEDLERFLLTLSDLMFPMSDPSADDRRRLRAFQRRIRNIQQMLNDIDRSWVAESVQMQREMSFYLIMGRSPSKNDRWKIINNMANRTMLMSLLEHNGGNVNRLREYYARLNKALLELLGEPA